MAVGTAGEEEDIGTTGRDLKKMGLAILKS